MPTAQEAYLWYRQTYPYAGFGLIGLSVLLDAPAIVGVLHYVAAEAAGDEQTVIRIPVLRTIGSSGIATVDIQAIDGTAVEGVDYVVLTPTLTWQNRQPGAQYIEVQLNDVTVDKTFKLKLTNPLVNLGGGFQSGKLLIAPPDEITVTIVRTPGPAGLVGFAQPTYAQQESRTLDVSVSRFGGSEGAVSVNFATEDGTAVAGVDYVASSGTLNWADLDDAPKTITLMLNTVSSDKNFFVRLSSPTGGVVISDLNNPVEIDILNAPAVPGNLAFDLIHIQTAESTLLTVRVRRVGGTSGAVGVSFATSNGTAVTPTDYTGTSGTLSWADADGADKTFNVTLNAVTGIKSFFLTLSSPTGGAGLLSGFSTAQVDIIDAGDPPPVPITDVLAEVLSFEAPDPNVISQDFLEGMAMFVRQDVLVITASGINTMPMPDVVSFGGGTGSFGGGVDLSNADETLDPIIDRFKIKKTIFIAP